MRWCRDLCSLACAERSCSCRPAAAEARPRQDTGSCSCGPADGCSGSTSGARARRRARWARPPTTSSRRPGRATGSPSSSPTSAAAGTIPCPSTSTSCKPTARTRSASPTTRNGRTSFELSSRAGRRTGSRIVFERDLNGPYNELVLVSVRTRRERMLLRVRGGDPVWGKAGIAYLTEDRQRQRIMRFGPAGRTAHGPRGGERRVRGGLVA